MANHNEATVMLGGVSQFSSERVSEEHLVKLLGAVNRVPSAANVQPWEIIVTETEEAGKERV